MKISNYMPKLTQNFNGLWGSTKYNCYTDYTVPTPIHYTNLDCEYYPFKDESNSDIEQIIQDNTTQQEYFDNKTQNKVIRRKTVEVQKRLPFLKQDFDNYSLNKCNYDTTKKIVELARELDLKI